MKVYYNSPGCLLFLLALVILGILVSMQASGTVQAAVVGAIFLLDLPGRGVHNFFLLRPKDREPGWFVSPSVGGHISFIPVWVFGLVCFGLAIATSIQEGGKAAPPPHAAAPPAVKPGPAPKQPGPKQPVPWEKPNFECAVKQQADLFNRWQYQISVTNRNPTAVNFMRMEVIHSLAGKSETTLAGVVTKMAPGKTTLYILKTRELRDLVRVELKGEDESGKEFTFSWKWTPPKPPAP
jgi:hypothetical protein